MKGSRCWSDTSRRAVSLGKSLTNTREKLDSVRQDKTKASSAGDFTAFSKFRKREEILKTRVRHLKTEIRHNQRDMDGTKTGRVKLEEEIAHTSSPQERRVLHNRLAAADALKFARQYAYEQETNPQVPLLRIA